MKGSSVLAFVLIGVVMAALIAANRAFNSGTPPGRDRGIEEHIRQTALPSAIEFVEWRFLSGCLLAFNSTEVLYAINANHIGSMSGKIIQIQSQPKNYSSHSVGDFQLEMFAHEGTGRLRSIELTFDFDPDFVPQSFAGSWHPLFEEARQKGWLRTTWKGMEFEAYDREGKGMEVVLRSQWPMPYWQPSQRPRQRIRDPRDIDERRNGRVGTWLLAQLIPGARAGYDPLFERSASWLIMPDRSVFSVRATETQGRWSTEVMPMTINRSWEELIEKIRVELPKLERYGVALQNGSLSWPSNLDRQKMADELLEEQIKAPRSKAVQAQ